MKYFLLLSACLFSLGLAAQQVVVSEELPLRNDIAYDVIGELKGRVLLFRNRTDKFEVQAFDENMRNSWNKEVELEKRQPSVIGVNSYRDSFAVLYHHRDKGNTIVRADQFDPSANKRKSVMLKDYGFTFFTPTFNWEHSEDRSKVLIYHTERNTFNVLVFDLTSFSLLWEKSFQIDDYTDGVDLLHMLVSNDGQMYLVMERDNVLSRRDKHRFDLFVCDANTPMLNQIALFMQDKVTYDVKFVVDNINKRFCAGGLYYERNIERAEGYFHLSLPSDNLLSHQLIFHSFDDGFVSDLEGKEIRQNRGIADIGITEIVLRKDGGMLLLGEENRNTTRFSSTVPRVGFDNVGRSTIDYYYNDIFAISIHPDGREHWKKVLYKKQYSQDDDGVYSSFFLFKTPAQVRLIFNDEIKFENTVSEYVIKGTGNNERHSLLSTELLKLRLRFRDAVQISADRMIVPSERRGQLRVAKIIL
jgi:hypothetical protein